MANSIDGFRVFSDISDEDLRELLAFKLDDEEQLQVKFGGSRRWSSLESISSLLGDVKIRKQPYTWEIPEFPRDYGKDCKFWDGEHEDEFNVGTLCGLIPGGGFIAEDGAEYENCKVKMYA